MAPRPPLAPPDFARPRPSGGHWSASSTDCRSRPEGLRRDPAGGDRCPGGPSTPQEDAPRMHTVPADRRRPGPLPVAGRVWEGTAHGSDPTPDCTLASSHRRVKGDMVEGVSTMQPPPRHPRLGSEGGGVVTGPGGLTAEPPPGRCLIRRGFWRSPAVAPATRGSGGFTRRGGRGLTTGQRQRRSAAPWIRQPGATKVARCEAWDREVQVRSARPHQLDFLSCYRGTRPSRISRRHRASWRTTCRARLGLRPPFTPAGGLQPEPAPVGRRRRHITAIDA